MNRPTADQIRAIYQNLTPVTPDLQGWHHDEPIFAELVAKVRPTTIVEIGSWKGASAVRMLNECRARGLDPLIFCVDFWQNPCLHTKEGGPLPVLQNPGDAYHLFCSNMRWEEAVENVIPVRMFSAGAAELLSAWGVVADLIYVDGGHDANTCFNDIVRYWPLLRKGGIMFGDDYTEEPGVAKAVQTFCQLNGLTFTHTYYHWTLEAKP